MQRCCIIFLYQIILLYTLLRVYAFIRLIIGTGWRAILQPLQVGTATLFTYSDTSNLKYQFNQFIYSPRLDPVSKRLTRLISDAWNLNVSSYQTICRVHGAIYKTCKSKEERIQKSTAMLHYNLSLDLHCTSLHLINRVSFLIVITCILQFVANRRKAMHTTRTCVRDNRSLPY